MHTECMDKCEIFLITWVNLGLELFLVLIPPMSGVLLLVARPTRSNQERGRHQGET